MSVPLGPPVRAASVLAASPGVRTNRKVGFLGSNSASLTFTPWLDQSWELWGHGSSVAWYRRPLDRYFDLHSPTRWGINGKKKGDYLKWLKGNTVPIFMQEKYPEVPASVRYPKERILMEYGQPRRYFTNHIAWMMALAFSEGVTTIGLFGINYGHHTEYETQRGCAEYWLGRAAERGINLIIPEECTLLSVPKSLYGYDSHDENGTLKEEYRPKSTYVPVAPTNRPAIPPPELAEEIAAEEKQRPQWAKDWMAQMKAPGAFGVPGNGETHGPD